jgi:adenylate cyclase
MHRFARWGLGKLLPERGALRPLPWVVVVAVGALLGMTGLSDPAQRLEWAFQDRVVRETTRDPIPPDDIVVVAIDEPSFREFDLQWPWPRHRHAQLIDALARGGARSIVFDLLFDAPSIPEDDQALVNAAQHAGNVILGIDWNVVDDRRYTLALWSEPFPALAESAAALGVVGLNYDPDGVIRHASPTIEGRPTLALAAARRVPSFVPPPDTTTPMLIAFRGASRHGIVTVSYYQALDAEHLLPAGIFRDKTVFVGHSLAAAPATEETADHFVTPIGPRTPGVEIHASLLDTLLRQRHVADPFANVPALVALCLVVAGAMGWVCYRLSPFSAGVLLLLLLVVAAGGALVLRRGDLLRLPVVAPACMAGCVFALTTSYRYTLGSRERLLMRRAFEHYVSPVIVGEILRDPSKLSLSGQEYDATIVFTDLEGFTSLAERLSPVEIRQQLSHYLEEMMGILLPARATLDKFIGDAIMVFFGCPVRDPEHALQACRAVLAMDRRMDALNAQWEASGLPRLRMRVGVNSGRVVAGNMGTSTVFHYTVIGDAVNLASRLEGINKFYGTRVLLGQDTWERVRHAFVTREVDLIRAKGKARPLSIHELIAEAGPLPPAKSALLDRFGTGLSAYRALEWARAAEDFGAALQIDPQDGPSRMLLERARRYETDPPPPDWDGIHVLTEK